MERIMDYNQMTSPCGINCENCEVYREYDGKDPRKFRFVIMLIRPFLALMAQFSKKRKITLRILDRMLKIPQERPLCRGCRNEDGKCLILSSDEPCKVYKCTKEKGIHNCSECNEFPCEHLYPSSIAADIAPHNTKIANLCLIKRYGLEVWSKEYSKEIQENYFKGEFPVDL
jgi:hypothetical protein